MSWALNPFLCLDLMGRQPIKELFFSYGLNACRSRYGDGDGDGGRGGGGNVSPPGTVLYVASSSMEKYSTLRFARSHEARLDTIEEVPQGKMGSTRQRLTPT